MIAVVEAESAAGDRHQITRLPTREDEARRVAARAARLIGVLGQRELWCGCKVIVVDATSGAVLFAARVPDRHGSPAPRSP